MSLSGNKKSFEFRMSKKVAELTQVVHMLFTRNHEKEVELEAVKEAYEHEIELVIKDAKSRIEKLEVRIRELEKQKGSLDEKEKEQWERDAMKREEEWKQKLNALDAQLQEEKKECQNARDLLIQAQMDIENLRQGQSNEVSRWNKEIDQKNKDLERLTSVVKTLEKKLKDDETQHSNTIAELQRLNSKLQKELSQSKETLQDADKMKEHLVMKNRQLELEIKALKKELGKRDKSARSSASSKDGIRDLSNATVLDYAEEIERLRKQVQRYRNELSNREDNFNRMFTEQSPVHVDRRAGRMAGSMDRTGADTPVPALRYSRERTSLMLGGTSAAATTITSLSVSSNRTASITSPTEDPDLRDYTNSPRSISSASGRLPHLGLDMRNRNIARLAKPKPLPRELLSAKAVGSG